MLNKTISKSHEHEAKKESTSYKTVFEVGQMVKSYEVLSLIVQKSKSDIYLAQNQATKEKVVIKAIRYSSIPKEKIDYRQRCFKQEFKMMQNLKHPNICRFIDYYSDGKLTFGIMEYIKGVSPRKLRRRKNLTLRNRCSIIVQMFSAVAYLHEKGLTHGDLHPRNFVVTDKNIVKLIDFGYTHHHKKLEGEVYIKGGVKTYLPPECLPTNSSEAASQRVDYRGEVFQLGVLAYIVLYDKKPFNTSESDDYREVIKHFNPPFQKMTKKNEKIPKAIIAILKQALHKDATHRFASAIELKNAFSRAKGVRLNKK